MPRSPLEYDPQGWRHSGLRTSSPAGLTPSFRSAEPAWIGWVVLGLFGLLGIWRVQLQGYLPESYVLWWRSTYALAGGEVSDPALGLYPISLPLFSGLIRGLMAVLAWLQVSDPLGGLQGIAVVICLWAGLWCWGRGNLWSFGLWALSPWVVELGMEPNAQVLAAFCLFLGSVTALPQRFIWLGVACGISFQAWPIAMLLALLWTAQSWPRYHALGLYGVLAAIAIIGISIRSWPWLAAPEQALSPQTQPWQILLGFLAPLVLCLGLVMVRMGWPWQRRHQAALGLGVCLYLGISVPLLWLLGWRGDLWGEGAARLGLLVLPLLGYVAGGVLEEIRSSRWRQLLGMLVLSGCLALSWQSLHLWSYRLLLNQPAQGAAQWLQEHHDQIQGLLVVDSATIAYLSQLPVEDLISSAAAEQRYGDPLADPIEWLVINQAEARAWGRSRLLEQHPEFANTSEISGWDLVYVNQESIPPISQASVQTGSPLQVAALSRPSLSVPIVQIWHRSPGG